MTVFCPLNQPQCKRSIMMSNAPFVKQECPISKGRKCAFAPMVCPVIYQDKEECYLSKIQDIASKGGCKVKQMSPLMVSQFFPCKDKKSSDKMAQKKTIYPPPNCAELPPCTKCSFGRPLGDTGGLDAKNNRRKKISNGTRTSVKNEDIKVAATPNRSGLNLGSPEIPFVPGRKKSGKTVKGRKPPGGSRKAEDIKVSACPCPEVPASQKPSQVASAEEREKIFREAIDDKVSKLAKNRESLLVPQCSTSSRRPMPCAGCLVDLLTQPPLVTQPETNYVYKSAAIEDRCRLNRILATCPALRVPSVCPKGCFCPDVALVEGEEDDDQICPLAGVGSRPRAKPTCPLTRLPKHPLVLDASRVPDKGSSFDACKCPLIPNNCCYTLPGCTVHTMRALADCPTNRNC